jgi:hypothetical protein
MVNIAARYTEEEVSEIVYRSEDRILENIREYIVDNIDFDGVGDLDFDSECFFEEADTKILFNLENEEIYEYRKGTDLGDYMDGLIESGKIVSVYDLNMRGLAAYIENEIIKKDDENKELIEKFEKKEITRDEYVEELEMLIYDRYIEDYMNRARLTIEDLNRL